MPTKSSIKPYIFEWVMWQQRFWYFPHKWLANWYMSRRPIASQNPMSNHGYPYPLSRKVKLSNQIAGIENQGATNLAKCQVVGTPVAKSWCLLRSADNATYVAQCSHTHTHTHTYTRQQKCRTTTGKFVKWLWKNFTYFDNEICLLCDENCSSAVVSHMPPTTTTMVIATTFKAATTTRESTI